MRQQEMGWVKKTGWAKRQWKRTVKSEHAENIIKKDKYCKPG